MNFKDELNSQTDKRKLDKLVDSGAISAEELANAPIISESECCGADLIGDMFKPQLYCSNCKKPCEGTTNDS